MKPAVFINEEPIQVLSFTVSHREGDVPRAAIIALAYPYPLGASFRITLDESTLFKGILIDQSHLDQHRALLKAAMVFDNVLEKCQELVAPLPICFGDKDHPSDALEDKPFVFHFSRNETISLSHIIEAPRTIALAQNMIGLTCHKKPRTQLQVDVKAHFLYRKRSFFDVNVSVATLTAAHFEKTWQLMSQVAGYRVLEGHLETVKTFPVGPFEEGLYVKGTQLRARISMMATEEQKITETASFTLGKGPRVKRLELCVPDLDTFDKAVFFDTDLGKAWLSHAFLYAQNHFYILNRCIHVSAVLPFTKDLWDIDLDSAFDIQGIGRGKLFSYAIENGTQIKLDIRIFDAQKPIKPSFDLQKKPDDDNDPFIESIHIDNEIDEQIKALKQGKTMVPTTRFFLSLKNLKKSIKRNFLFT